MRIFGYSVEDWITLLTFLGGLIFGLLKFYVLFIDMNATLKKLNNTVSSIEERFSSHEMRIIRLEEQNKNISKNIGRKNK